MNYPIGFPAEFKPAVEVVIAKRKRIFFKRAPKLPPSYSFNPTPACAIETRQTLEKLVKDRVKASLRDIVLIVCRAVNEQAWSSHLAASGLEEILFAVAGEAYSDAEHLSSDDFTFFYKDLEREITTSPLWIKCLNALQQAPPANRAATRIESLTARAENTKPSSFAALSGGAYVGGEALSARLPLRVEAEAPRPVRGRGSYEWKVRVPELDYKFPEDFPQTSKRQVLTVHFTARAPFAERPFTNYMEVHDQTLDWMCRVFATWSKQLCDLGKQGKWDASQIETEVRRIRRHLLLEAASIGVVAAADDFDKSHEWKAHVRCIGEVAEQQAKQSSESKSNQPGLSEEDAGGFALEQLTAPRGQRPLRQNPKPSNWEQVEIRVLGDERIQFFICGVPSEVLNYAEMGLEDRRRHGRPNQTWGLLLALSRLPGGIWPDDLKASKEWLAVAARFGRLRKALKKHVGLHTDPLPYNTGQGYHPTFKISRAPSADS